MKLLIFVFCLNLCSFYASLQAQTRSHKLPVFCASHNIPVGKAVSYEQVPTDVWPTPELPYIINLLQQMTGSKVDVFVSESDPISSAVYDANAKRITIGVKDLKSRGTKFFVLTLLHEFGHVAQVDFIDREVYLNKTNSPSFLPLWEEHADFLAGFFIGQILSKEREFEHSKTCGGRALPLGWEYRDSIIVHSDGDTGRACKYPRVFSSVGFGFKLHKSFLEYRRLGELIGNGATHPTPTQRFNALLSGYSEIGSEGTQTFFGAAKKIGISDVYNRLEGQDASGAITRIRVVQPQQFTLVDPTATPKRELDYLRKIALSTNEVCSGIAKAFLDGAFNHKNFLDRLTGGKTCSKSDKSVACYRYDGGTKLTTIDDEKGFYGPTDEIYQRFVTEVDSAKSCSEGKLIYTNDNEVRFFGSSELKFSTNDSGLRKISITISLSWDDVSSQILTLVN